MKSQSYHIYLIIKSRLFEAKFLSHACQLKRLFLKNMAWVLSYTNSINTVHGPSPHPHCIFSPFHKKGSPSVFQWAEKPAGSGLNFVLLKSCHIFKLLTIKSKQWKKIYVYFENCLTFFLNRFLKKLFTVEKA